MRSRIYVGRLLHARHEPVRHVFEYPVWYVCLDLAELDEIHRRLRLFGLERRRPVAFWPQDHLGGGSGSLAGRSAEELARSGREAPFERIELITAPRVFGHAFNPASFYRFVDADGRATAHLVEVNNTFGQGHVYALGGEQELHDRPVEHHCDKRLHVSPFYPVDGEYRFRFDAWDERLDLRIDLEREGAPSFHARLRAASRPLSDRALAGLLVRRPLAVAATLPRILRQAATLYLRKGLEFHAQPETADARTYRSTRPPRVGELRLPGPLERLGRWALGDGERR